MNTKSITTTRLKDPQEQGQSNPRGQSCTHPSGNHSGRSPSPFFDAMRLQSAGSTVYYPMRSHEHGGIGLLRSPRSPPLPIPPPLGLGNDRERSLARWESERVRFRSIWVNMASTYAATSKGKMDNLTARSHLSGLPNREILTDWRRNGVESK